jgi:hypothetical protein
MIAPIAPAARPTGEPPPEPEMSTHLAAVTEDDNADDDLDRPPRRSLVVPIVLGLLVLALVLGGVSFLHHAGEPPVTPDAGVVALPIDARPPDRAPVPDAGAVDAEAPQDAAAEPPVDAPPDGGHHRPVRMPLDAGRTASRDAPAPEPAAVIDAPQGAGALVAKHKGDQFLNVVLDGRIIGPTPIFGDQIPAGSHVIELVDPRTSKVVVRRTVKVNVGETVTVVEP